MYMCEWRPVSAVTWFASYSYFTSLFGLIHSLYMKDDVGMFEDLLYISIQSGINCRYSPK